MSHRPFPARIASAITPRIPRARLTSLLAAGAMASTLLVGATAPAQAATYGDSPLGAVDSVTAVSGGLRVTGWAWDPNTTASVDVNIAVGSYAKSTLASGYRTDIAKLYPDAGSRRNFSRDFTIPAGTYKVCATATNVGAGSNTTFPCKTVTYTGSAVTAVSTATTAPTGTTTTTAPTGTTTTTTAPAKLSWAPPTLVSPTTVNVSTSNRNLKLDKTRDYIIKMPSTPLTGLNGLVIYGGRNVVLIGGEIKISTAGSGSSELRGLFLKEQTGTVHVEGLRITGSTLAEGINLDQRSGATVQLQNIRVDTVHGSYSGMHADVLQTWAGPAVLRVDGLTGYTGYQGFFLLPKQFGEQPEPRLFDFRNVNIVGTSTSAYMMWRDGLNWPVTTKNVWVKPARTDMSRSQFLYARGATTSGSWNSVQVGVPAAGDFVPAGRAGIGYTTPGYL